jgi:hypothetical protein
MGGVIYYNSPTSLHVVVLNFASFNLRHDFTSHSIPTSKSLTQINELLLSLPSNFRREGISAHVGHPYMHCFSLGQILTLNIQFVPSYLFAALCAADHCLIPANSLSYFALFLLIVPLSPSLPSSLMFPFHFDITRQISRRLRGFSFLKRVNIRKGWRLPTVVILHQRLWDFRCHCNTAGNVTLTQNKCGKLCFHIEGL